MKTSLYLLAAFLITAVGVYIAMPALVLIGLIAVFAALVYTTKSDFKPKAEEPPLVQLGPEPVSEPEVVKIVATQPEPVPAPVTITVEDSKPEPKVKKPRAPRAPKPVAKPVVKAVPVITAKKPVVTKTNTKRGPKPKTKK